MSPALPPVTEGDKKLGVGTDKGEGKCCFQPVFPLFLVWTICGVSIRVARATVHLDEKKHPGQPGVNSRIPRQDSQDLISDLIVRLREGTLEY